MAQDMYVSPLFKKMLGYAHSLDPKDIFILSALYGLLELDEIISPYEMTLKKMGIQRRKSWASDVLADLGTRCDLHHDEFVILAGNPYREYLIPELAHYTVPMKGLTFGQQLQWLGEQCNV